MRKDIPVRGLALLLSVLPAALVAQEPETVLDTRVSTLGKIRDRGGKPWEGARIVFLSRLHPVCAEQSVDRVEVVSDARGKFRAMLERDRVYIAWGHGAAKDGKGWRLSALAAEVLPSQVLRLSELRTRAVRSIQIKDEREVKGKLGLKLISTRPGHSRADRGDVQEGMGFVFPLEMDAEGKATIPPLPWNDLWLEIYDHQGLRIQIEGLRALDTWKAEEKLVGVHGAMATKLHARAVRGLGAIDGLTLYQRVRGRLLEVKRIQTGDTLQVPLQVPQRLLEMSRAESEYPDLELGTEGSVRALLLQVLAGNTNKAVGLGSDRMVMLLAPGRKLKGRLGKPRLLVLQQNPGGRPGAFMATMAPYPVYERQANADGSFVFEGLGIAEYRLLTPLTLAEREALRGDASIEPLALLSAGHLGKDRDLGVLDPARLVRVDLSLRYPDGKKASGARILLMDQGNVSTKQAVILRSLSDRTGRRRLLLPVGQRFELLVVSKRGSTVLALDLRQAKPASLRPVELTIPLGVRIRGRVVDGNGDPCARCRMYWTGRSGVSRAGVLARRSAPDLFTLRTDTDGRFSFLAPMQKGQLLLFTNADAKRPTVLKRLKLDGEEIEDLEIVVQGK